MKLLQRIILFFISSYCLAQGEANIWYFGENAGLDFNSGVPVPLNNSQLNTIEGCSSFSDSDGNLLFYSDGTTVWNRNHAIMPNGNFLNGDPSSTQSAMIIPRPGSTTEFYIFTVDNISNNNDISLGFNYYTIDMTANGGLGDVVAGPVDLNQGLAAAWSEKVAAVKSANGDAYWVVSYVVDKFVAYEVTQNGVISIPVESPSGNNITDGRGYLKISPDGTKLAIAHMRWYTEDGILGLYDFNASTGEVINLKTLPLNTPANQPYGIEFSSNSTKLYVHASNDFMSNDPIANNLATNHTSILYQFDVSLPTIADIIASKVILDDRNLFRGALQLGPDGKIYRTLAQSYEIGNSNLGVIECPNKAGRDAMYLHNAIDLGSANATQGLPPFIASLFSDLDLFSDLNNAVVTDQTVSLCLGRDYTFYPEEIEGALNFSWTLNDVEISTDEILILTNVTFANAGTYILTQEVINDCGDVLVYTGSFFADVFAPPSIPSDLYCEQCDIDSNPTDGITLFNLTDKNEEILGGNPDLIVSYYNSLTDLDNNNPITDPINYTASNNSIVYFKLENTVTGCYDTGEFDLFVYPTSLDSYDAIYACETNISTDSRYSLGSGTATFDLETKRQEILDLFVVQDINISFYNSIEDAQVSLNPLDGFIELDSQTIFVKITDKATNNCISVGQFEVIMNELPIVSIQTDVQILCVDNPIGNPQLHTLPLDATTGNSSDSFQWYLDGNPIPEGTDAIWNANDGGVYTVEITRNYADGSSCSAHTTFEIQLSNPGLILNEYVEIVDDSENNSITLLNTNLGLGEYDFSLNDINGPYQEVLFYEGLDAGHHTIYIRDNLGCAISTYEFSILGFPRFFTPNNDGYNDTWNILGLNPNFYATSQLHIFDRFGKLLASLNPLTEGWDGVYNGELMPSTDYWFTVELTDNLGTTRLRRGHFSLIRR